MRCGDEDSIPTLQFLQTPSFFHKIDHPVSSKKDTPLLSSLMALELQFHLDLDFDIHLDSAKSKPTISLASLRIQIPQGEPHHSTEKERPVEKKKEQEQEQEQDDDVEYVPVSPRYTWSDEQIRGIKQERMEELLWPIILRSYGITDSSSHFASYSSFRRSAVSRNSENYPHRSVRDLMIWYIEDHLHLLKKSEACTENLKRRWLLRKCYQKHNLAWLPEYFELYMAWSKGCHSGMNRHQKMEEFIKVASNKMRR